MEVAVMSDKVYIDQKDADTVFKVKPVGARYAFFAMFAAMMSLGIAAINTNLTEIKETQKQALEIQKRRLELEQRRMVLDSLMYNDNIKHK